MKFFIKSIFDEKREVLEDGLSGLKSEEITLSINLTSSGDTSKFTTNEIKKIIFQRLDEIKPEK